MKWWRYITEFSREPYFPSVGADTGRLYSGSEASDVVFQYVEKENLVKPTDKSTVVLDPPLCDALFKGAIKKGSTYHNVIHKKDLGSTFWQDAATPFGD
ncbi:unnamed protein product [Linum tenue]|uniref:eIF2D SWIB domain-containing protein n=1 Tax=Linum tenue TaxID=586396 RepID=A0AAV0NKN4_9ROSI|nr:unnamed protein product [Linum tenue]